MSADTQPSTETVSMTSQPLLTALRRALHKAKKLGEGILVYQNLPNESGDLLPLVSESGSEHFRCFWEKPDEGFALACTGAVVSSDFNSQENRQEVIHKMERVLAQGVDCSTSPQQDFHPRLVAGFAFDLDGPVDQHASTGPGPWGAFPRGRIVLPECMVNRRNNRTVLTVSWIIQPWDNVETIAQTMEASAASAQNRLTVAAPDKDRSQCVEELEIPNRVAWMNRVAQAKSQLGPQLSKVVLARTLRLEFDGPISLHQMLNRLRVRYPECFTFMFDLPGSGTFVGATPERLLRIDDDVIYTEALAGTISRGATPGDDHAQSKALLKDPKEQSEHAYVVEFIRKRLEPITDELKIPSEPTLFYSQDVMHLRTPISARLKVSISGLELASRLHPTPAVAGTPTQSATEAILKSEGLDRGWYAGVLGWLDGQGAGDFVVGLRSALIREHTAYLFAGGGIVAGSIPEKEWEETNLKFQAMLHALCGSSELTDGTGS